MWRQNGGRIGGRMEEDRGAPLGKELQDTLSAVIGSSDSVRALSQSLHDLLVPRGLRGGHHALHKSLHRPEENPIVSARDQPKSRGR